MARATRSSRPRPRRCKKLGKFKTLSKGLKNYVLSDETSIDEAMAAARSDEERELTAQQLDAFHSTFNFCMTCRQYTCANCWNQAEGLSDVLTCAPHPRPRDHARARSSRSCAPPCPPEPGRGVDLAGVRWLRRSAADADEPEAVASPTGDPRRLTWRRLAWPIEAEQAASGDAEPSTRPLEPTGSRREA